MIIDTCGFMRNIDIISCNYYTPDLLLTYQGYFTCMPVSVSWHVWLQRRFSTPVCFGQFSGHFPAQVRFIDLSPPQFYPMWSWVFPFFLSLFHLVSSAGLPLGCYWVIFLLYAQSTEFQRRPVMMLSMLSCFFVFKHFIVQIKK